MSEGAESKMNDNSSSSVNNPVIARWDTSVNASNIEYSNNEREATKKTKDWHTTIRTVFFKRGRHTLNIKVKHLGHVGIGIIGTSFPLYKDSIWIGSTDDSYGTFDNCVAYFKSEQLKSCIKHEIKIQKGDIVKVDLDLYVRTFAWE
eukprot:399003_1